MTSQIRVDLIRGIPTITLARPDKKDALTNEMYGALADTIYLSISSDFAVMDYPPCHRGMDRATVMGDRPF